MYHPGAGGQGIPLQYAGEHVKRKKSFPETLPDYSTVWQFRERLAESGRDRLVWEKSHLEPVHPLHIHSSTLLLMSHELSAQTIE